MTSMSRSARELAVGIVISTFNEAITGGLQRGAMEELHLLGVTELTVLSVEGALELPVVAKALAASHDAVVAIGAVIEGETDHYEHVATQASRGLMDVSVDTGVPIGNAVLTVRDVQHAVVRSQPGPGNKGAEAAKAAVTAALAIKSLD